MNPTERLARAMGYETRTESPGYGVTRVLISKGSSPYATWQVFSPRADGLQFAEVLAWLCRLDKCGMVVLSDRLVTARNGYEHLVDGAGIAAFRSATTQHKSNGTGPDLMRAVCDAAERVAERMA